MIALQAWKGDEPNSASTNSLIGNLAAFSTLALRELGSYTMHHTWCASKARLNSSMFLKSSASEPFDIDISSQATQKVFLFPSLLPHQKSHRRLSICLHRPLGSLKHDIEYIGVAWVTALINTSLPPAERHCSIHPCTFCHTLSLR